MFGGPRTRMALRGAVFVGLVGLEVWLGRGISARPSIRGFVDTKSYAVATPQHAIVRKIDVVLGQAVTAGQVIAELDPGTIEADLAAKLAERKRLVAALRDASTKPGAGSAAAATAPEATSDALRAIDIELEALADKRDSLRLKSPADGVVESIDARQGDAVGASTPVATVVASDTRRVMACLPETRTDDVGVGTVATVSAIDGGHEVAGAVESLTPAIAPLPARCQIATSKAVALGRVAVVVLDRATDMLPGQSQAIAFGSEKRPVTGSGSDAGAQVPAAGEAPAMIDVPPELAGITRLEASGIVWMPSLDRYVIVSDETGTGDTNHKPPWLFTMSRRGVIDPEPIVIEGLDSIDDIESISADANGGLWIAASQSISAKGKRPRAREVIAHLAPSGAGFKLDRKTHLASMLADPANAGALAALEVPDLEALDIEGMAVHDGALYLGLKAPVGKDGAAMIWKVAQPEKLLANDFAGAGVTIAARVQLSVEVDGKPVPGGIADLIFLDDHRIALGVTASGISAKHQRGVVGIATLGTTDKPAFQPIRTFAELRPEGLAIDPTDAHRLTVVFDRGHDAPMWTQVDVPAPSDL